MPFGEDKPVTGSPPSAQAPAAGAAGEAGAVAATPASPPAALGDPAPSSTAAELVRLEARVLEAERRFVPAILHYLDVRKNHPPEDPRRRAARTALLWCLFPFNNAASAAGFLGLFLTVVTVYLAYQANMLIREELTSVREQNKLSRQQFEGAQKQFDFQRGTDVARRRGELLTLLHARKDCPSDGHRECPFIAETQARVYALAELASLQQALINVGDSYLTLFLPGLPGSPGSPGRFVKAPKRAELASVVFHDVVFPTSLELANLEFDEADFRYSAFGGSTLNGVSFRDARLRGVKFDGTDLTNVSFLNADLRHADFSGARLNSCSFYGARLQGAMFSPEQRADLAGDLGNVESCPNGSPPEKSCEGKMAPQVRFGSDTLSGGLGSRREHLEFINAVRADLAAVSLRELRRIVERSRDELAYEGGRTLKSNYVVVLDLWKSNGSSLSISVVESTLVGFQLQWLVQAFESNTHKLGAAMDERLKVQADGRSVVIGSVDEIAPYVRLNGAR